MKRYFTGNFDELDEFMNKIMLDYGMLVESVEAVEYFGLDDNLPNFEAFNKVLFLISFIDG